MIKDQNRIELQVRRGIYEEFTLRMENTGHCLPGTLVAMTSDEQTHAVNWVDSQASDLDGFETIVVLENALFGKTINAKSYNGERILCRRAVSGDMYLLRAVPGVYESGQPVYATQTPNGIYVSGAGEGKFVGWAQENFTVTPTMIDLLDDSTRDTPSTTNLNGALVNLLRVRIGNKKRSGTAVPLARFTVMPDGDSTTDTTLLTIKFTKFSELVTPALILSEIALSPNLTAGVLTQIDASTYTLSVTTVSGGASSLTITKVDVSPAPVSFSVFKYIAPPPPVPIGWYGAWYPDSAGIFPAFDDSFLGFAATVEVTGAKGKLVTSVAPLQTDWDAILPSPPEPWSLWDDAGYRIFVLIKDNDWGTMSIWDPTESIDQTVAFDDISVVVGGETYNGKLSPILGAATPITVKFT